MKDMGRISGKLSQESLIQLLDMEIDAIHVTCFYPTELSKRFAEKIMSHPELGYYKKQYTVERLGMGYIDVGKTPEFTKEYHEKALDSIRLIRDLVYPHISPLDHLRLILQEIWPAGANIEHLNSQKCFVGSCRVIGPGVALLPHNDRLARMLFDAETDVSGQLAVNVYLQMPRKGGEVELWLVEPTPEQDKAIDADDGLNRRQLPPPKLLIRPDVGDLVIFNSHLIHSVAAGENGHRVTMSSFIGYRGKQKPLTYWS